VNFVEVHDQILVQIKLSAQLNLRL